MTAGEAVTANGRRKGRPRVREVINLGLTAAAFQDPCEPSVAMIFLLMARRLPLGVKAYPHRHDPDGWCFKFIQSGLLEIDRDGVASWISGGLQVRRAVDAVLARARERAGVVAWRVPPGGITVSRD